MPFPAMRPPATRLAAVESLAHPVFEQWNRRFGQVRGDPKWVQEQRSWEIDARAYARYNGVAGFNALVVADMCARCELFVEERDQAGDWHETKRPELLFVLDDYQNRWQSTKDIVRAHAWRYQVDGHAIMAWWDTEFGVQYGVFSTAAVEVDKPHRGAVTIKLAADGKVEEQTAFVVPREQTFHVWQPDFEEMLKPTSPMMGSIEDLHRYHALARQVWRRTESHLAMDGIMWFPGGGEGDEQPPPEVADVDVGDAIATPKGTLEEGYYDAARLAYTSNDDIAAIAPTFMQWDKELGAPTWVKVGEGLDPQSLEERRAAIEDAARPWAVPSTVLLGGGVGNANHWSEWLASEKFVESGITPNMDRIAHMDITRVFLHPRLRFEGWSEDSLRTVRIGYSTTPIVVKPDRSDIALKAHSVGAIGYEALREVTGFEPGDAPTPDDDERTLKFLAKSAEGQQPPGAGGPLPAGPATLTKGPPQRPTEPPSTNGNGAAPTPAAVAALLGSVLSEYADAHAG